MKNILKLEIKLY